MSSPPNHLVRDLKQRTKRFSMPSTESLILWIPGRHRRGVTIYTTELGMFRRILHNDLIFKGSEGVGISHWGVLLGDDVFELQTARRLPGQKNRLFKIEKGTLSSGRYDGYYLNQHQIGKTVASQSRIESIRKALESIGGGEYDIYRNNCQLIAGALAVAVSEKPDEAFRKLDDLHFVNRKHKAQIRDLLKEILSKSTYETYFGHAGSAQSQSHPPPSLNRTEPRLQTYSPTPTSRLSRYGSERRSETHSPASTSRSVHPRPGPGHGPDAHPSRTPPNRPPACNVLRKRRPSPAKGVRT